MNYKQLFDMSGKVCVVVGGSGYLGTENVKILKDFGATVVNADFQEGPTAADLYMHCDIASTESIAELYQKVAERYGRIDVMINCAVMLAGYGKASQIDKMSDEVWAKGIEGGLNSAFRVLREVIPYMKERGGSIINYCSMYGVVAPDLRIYGEDNPSVNPPNYGASKAGVAQLTRYAAGALAKYNIRVNCVTPGPFPKAPRNEKNGEFYDNLAYKTMLGRFGKSHEIAGAVLLLASDASSFMTGSNVVVDGGWTAW